MFFMYLDSQSKVILQHFSMKDKKNSTKARWGTDKENNQIQKHHLKQ